MSLDIFPSFSLNITSLDVSDLNIRNIVFTDFSVKAIYNVFFCMFFTILIQTITIIVAFYKFNKMTRLSRNTLLANN